MEGFHEIYQRYARDVYRFAMALSGNRAIAEDLMSETFLRAMASARPLQTQTVKAYLFTITRNLFLEQRKRASRQTSFDEDSHGEQLSVEQDLTQQQHTQQLLQALQQLPEHERVVLLLRAYDDMTYEEIAQLLTISVAAAKVRVHRARFRLTQILEDVPS